MRERVGERLLARAFTLAFVSWPHFEGSVCLALVVVIVNASVGASTGYASLRDSSRRRRRRRFLPPGKREGEAIGT
jgi:hypothetical protein